jgi:mono/diheme cytochrome c family protein
VTRLLAAFACCTVSLAAISAKADDERARQNYLLQCAGCHGENGDGLEGHVPSLRGPFASFAKEPQGRAYLLRVPGVTQSTLDPGLLAEVMNWALRNFSPPQAASAVRPFTAGEIAAAKRQPLLEVVATRETLVRTPE